MKLSFNVKEKSIVSYLTEMTVESKGHSRTCDGSMNPYYFMKDELYFKKERGIAVGIFKEHVSIRSK